MSNTPEQAANFLSQLGSSFSEGLMMNERKRLMKLNPEDARGQLERLINFHKTCPSGDLSQLA